MTNSQKELAVHKESVRCMSKVFDDIAQLVGLPKEQYGDPDALMDAIQSLKDANARWERKLDVADLELFIETVELPNTAGLKLVGDFFDKQQIAVLARDIIEHLKGE